MEQKQGSVNIQPLSSSSPPSLSLSLSPPSHPHDHLSLSLSPTFPPSPSPIPPSFPHSTEQGLPRSLGQGSCLQPFLRGYDPGKRCVGAGARPQRGEHREVLNRSQRAKQEGVPWGLGTSLLRCEHAGKRGPEQSRAEQSETSPSNSGWLHRQRGSSPTSHLASR